MAATKWKVKRVLVEIAVYDDCVSEKDLRWAVESALTDSRTFDSIIRRREPSTVRLGRLNVKAFTKVKASGALEDA